MRKLIINILSNTWFWIAIILLFSFGFTWLQVYGISALIEWVFSLHCNWKTVKKIWLACCALQTLLVIIMTRK